MSKDRYPKRGSQPPVVLGSMSTLQAGRNLGPTIGNTEKILRLKNMTLCK